MTRDVAVVLPAAGAGRRMGGAKKPFLEILGRPLLAWALEAFLRHERIGWIVIALPPEEYAYPPDWLRSHARADEQRVLLVPGGAERGDSVRAGVDAVPGEAKIILVHDAARPLLTRALVDRLIEAASAGHGAVPALAVGDTVKEVDEQGRVVATRDRARLRRVQTPQAFPAGMLRGAYQRAAADAFAATDDAALVEHYGGAVIAVDGEPENIKVTTPADLLVAEALMRARA